jgi:hypothetical protein
MARMESAMRVPTIHYREAKVTEEERSSLSVNCVIGAGVLVSALVWVLAIAKVVDLCHFP